jgi:histidine phosphotransferase ChpT
MIRNVTEQARARLQFARFAFGAAGSAGSVIDLGTAEQISRGFIGQNKHRLTWQGNGGHMPKDRVKLLLNLVAIAQTALPRGGDIDVAITGSVERPLFALSCRGAAARPPQYLTELVSGMPLAEINALNIQAYYTWRLAIVSAMRLEIHRDGPDIVLVARA